MASKATAPLSGARRAFACSDSKTKQQDETARRNSKTKQQEEDALNMPRSLAPAVGVSHGDVRDMLAAYLERFPDERKDLRLLGDQLAAEEDCFHRGNMRGHVTASAIVLSDDRSRFLLVHHKALDRWLPPGGHLEGDSSLWAAAEREVLEETSVAGLNSVPPAPFPLPIDVDSHAIAANARKAEGAHVHHDFCFLALAPAGCVLAPELGEVHAVRWASLTELDGADSSRLVRIARKLSQWLPLPQGSSTKACT